MQAENMRGLFRSGMEASELLLPTCSGDTILSCPAVLIIDVGYWAFCLSSGVHPASQEHDLSVGA